MEKKQNRRNTNNSVLVDSKHTKQQTLDSECPDAPLLGKQKACELLNTLQLERHQISHLISHHNNARFTVYDLKPYVLWLYTRITEAPGFWSVGGGAARLGHRSLTLSSQTCSSLFINVKNLDISQNGVWGVTRIPAAWAMQVRRRGLKCDIRKTLLILLFLVTPKPNKCVMIRALRWLQQFT